ncbi:MAG TPA: Hsp33 family molecular chaperone HslO [Burkholderiaceae bacterium]|nr:Hsp33 family molecular chaperone HslO [Burkholderiaceae bacterium]
MSDRLLKFMFRGAPVRGELVRVADAWREMTAHHQYPAPVKRLLGEMVAAAALLASNIKFNGALVMQVHGDGPVKLLVVECQPDLSMRATAKFSEQAVASGATMRELINRTGRGRFAITLDPRDPAPGQQPYQGIVPLDGDTMADVLENYMRQSEQLETRLVLAADEDVSAGLLLQRLPDTGGTAGEIDEDAWDRVTTLGATLSAEELLRLSPENLARRLYSQEVLDHQATLAPRFACRCSRERIGRMLVSLGREEVDSIIAELATVTVTCDFCGRQYAFDVVDAAQLFASGETIEADSTRQH